MTITQHLEFSVLSAPLASVDRRSLSQAWYSALYGDAAPPCESPASSATRAVTNGERGAESEPRTQLRALRPAQPSPIKASAPISPRIGVPESERRAARSPLARKIEHAFLRPHNAPRTAAFALGGSHGRVQIVLQQRGERVQLVAICPPRARERVARALAEARYALAARGIALDTTEREVSC